MQEFSSTTYLKMLKEEYTARKAHHSRYSGRAFSKLLGINSGTMTRIMNDQRIPTEEQTRMIIEKLRWSDEMISDFNRSIELAKLQRGDFNVDLEALQNILENVPTDIQSGSGSCAIRIQSSDLDAYKMIVQEFFAKIDQLSRKLEKGCQMAELFGIIAFMRQQKNENSQR